MPYSGQFWSQAGAVAAGFYGQEDQAGAQRSIVQERYGVPDADLTARLLQAVSAIIGWAESWCRECIKITL